mmetsp:Transcript_12115/g.16492  ORF Transcript_12115/g.16492 Transcript_12115/m.16492 type:complete len:252 (+) Transcript_12115:37-792(+)
MIKTTNAPNNRQRPIRPPTEIALVSGQTIIKISEDYKQDTLGSTIWSSAIILCCMISQLDYFPYGSFKGKRVLDLGSGTGVMGLALALLGAKEVVLADNESSLIQVMRENIELNGVSDRVRAVLFDWTLDPQVLGSPFDIVVACDCIYYGGDGLGSCLAQCCNAGGYVLLAYEPRGQVWGECDCSLEMMKTFQVRSLEIDGLTCNTRPDDPCPINSFWHKWTSHPVNLRYRKEGHMTFDRIKVLKLVKDID